MVWHSTATPRQVYSHESPLPGWLKYQPGLNALSPSAAGSQAKQAVLPPLLAMAAASPLALMPISGRSDSTPHQSGPGWPHQSALACAGRMFMAFSVTFVAITFISIQCNTWPCSTIRVGSGASAPAPRPPRQLNAAEPPIPPAANSAAGSHSVRQPAHATLPTWERFLLPPLCLALVGHMLAGQGGGGPPGPADAAGAGTLRQRHRGHLKTRRGTPTATTQETCCCGPWQRTYDQISKQPR